MIMMFNHAVNACPVRGVFYVKLRKINETLFLQCTNFMYTLQLLPLLAVAIIPPLHNNKQYVGNISVWD